MRDRKAFVDIKMISAKAFLIPKYARGVAGCQSARKELPVVDPVGGKFTV